MYSHNIKLFTYGTFTQRAGLGRRWIADVDDPLEQYISSFWNLVCVIGRQVHGDQYA